MALEVKEKTEKKGSSKKEKKTKGETLKSS
jgi:hypothetical protein